MRLALAGLVALALALPDRPAKACGLTPPIGPSGLPTACRGDIPRVHAGISVGGTSTRIDFPAGTARLLQGATVVAVDVNPFVETVIEPLTLTLVGGASLGGRLTELAERWRIHPGALVGAGVSYRFGGHGSWPFVQPSASLSMSFASADSASTGARSFRALDWRLGAAIGKTIGGFAAPFVVGRWFGGGTDFAPAGGHGSDHYRWHAGAGSAFAISPRVDAVVELAFLGERRGTVGFGYSF